jgi:hypothetical protein
VNARALAPVGACCLALLGAVRPPQVSPASLGVQATVDVSPGQSFVRVHIRNLASADLEAWQIRLVYDLGSGLPSTLDITTDNHHAIRSRNRVPVGRHVGVMLQLAACAISRLIVQDWNRPPTNESGRLTC